MIYRNELPRTATRESDFLSSVTKKEEVIKCFADSCGGEIVLASHQPDFMPWLGYFYKIFQSDIFVFSDDVQYSKSGRHNYNQILTGNGPMKFTLPIHYHAVNLNELKLAVDDNIINKMLKTIFQEYKKAEHFSEVFPVIELLLMEALSSDSLAEFNMRCIMKLCEKFGLLEGRLFLLSSALGLKERRDPRIIEMCERVGATTYFSGVAAKDYHIEEDYRRHGVSLVYSDYEPLVYPQVGKRSAINMCIIDYVMNCGFNLPKEWKRRTKGGNAE